MSVDSTTTENLRPAPRERSHAIDAEVARASKPEINDQPAILDRALTQLHDNAVDRAIPTTALSAQNATSHSFLKNWCLPFATAWLVVAFFAGTPVPTSNEWAYLVLLKKASHPEWIAGDWTLAEPNVRHYCFNLTFGWLPRFASLQAVGWIGRICCWTLTLLLLFRIGQRLRLRPGTVAIGVSLWLATGQALVGGEWVFGGFEAKAVAYILLFSAVNAALRDRHWWAAVCLGASFSFHPAVGLWGGIALLPFAIWSYGLSRRLVQVGAVVVLLALPGAIPVILHGSPVPAAELKFQALVRMPYHLDPLIWDRSLMLVGLMMTALMVVIARQQPDVRVRQFLLAVPLAMLAIFSVGVLARLLGVWHLLLLMPFRHWPLFVPLLFMLLLVGGVRRDIPFPKPTFVLLLIVLILIGLPNPLVNTATRAKTLAAAWTKPDDDLTKSYKWIAANTPSDSTIIAPPWRDDALYLTERPQIVAWAICPQPLMAQWRQRLEALRGADWSHQPGRSWDDAMQAGYESRTAADIRGVRGLYGGEILVSRTAYDWPIIKEFGEWKIYDLSGDEVDNHSIQ